MRNDDIPAFLRTPSKEEFRLATEFDALGLRVGAASCGALLDAALFDGRDVVRLGAVCA
jgi:hypothetical protein